MRRRVASAVAVVALIVLAGCSDGDDSADDEPSATETTTLATTAQPSLASQVEDAFSMSYGWPNQPKWQHIKQFSDDNAPRVTVVTDLADAPASETEAQGYCEAVVSVSGSVNAEFTGAEVTAGDGGPVLAECDVPAA